ncbi:MAG: DUF2085 domain-containing protein [Epulopiscium sp.]|nr:DUF2085 domain-containing protein [Candidatus Epulonipiscium sp.]
MKEIVYFLCNGICHQLPDRSLKIGHSYLPLCARCTGIYIGVFVSFIYLLLRKRWHGNRPPSYKVLCVLLLSYLPLLWDGATSYLGFRSTHNLIRLITGVLLGSTLPIFILLIKNYDIRKNNEKILVRNIIEYIHILVVGIIFAFTIYFKCFFSWHFLAFLLTCSIYILYVQLFIGILQQIFYNSKNKKIYFHITAYIMALGWMNALAFLQSWLSQWY